MGKNFPLITNLKETPKALEKTIAMIEKSFAYEAPFTFKEDFASLVEEGNHHNCFIMMDENENVIAHIGVKERNIRIKGALFPICMLGGIAVDEKYRGEGHFQTLLQDVLAEKRSDCALFLLWSDQAALYKKYGFYLCGDQFEIPKSDKKSSLVPTKYHLLSENEKKQIQALYQSSFASQYTTLDRTKDDWNSLEKVTSADLYIRKEASEITDYLFMNKGQDLTGIIYEYGSKSDLRGWLKEASSLGKIWLGQPLMDTDNHQYQFFLAPADMKYFRELITAMTKDLMKVRDVNVMKQEVYFDFNDETLSLEAEEFLRGIFGPGQFEEVDVAKYPLFISGLDSI
jgi:predicted N-acetyltransferase YhbS